MAIAILAVIVAAALVGLVVLSRDSPQPAAAPPSASVHDAMWVQDAPSVTVTPPALHDAAQDAPAEAPQIVAVRSSGTATEPWVGDAAALASKLAPGATTRCFVAGCIVEVPVANVEAAQRAFAADTTWTGGKQWLGATLILYRPD